MILQLVAKGLFDRLLLVRRYPWMVLAAIMISIWSAGIQLSPDAIHYLEIGKNISEGKGVVTYHLNLASKTIPDPILPWPPLYPLLLALWMKIGLTSIAAARAVLILSFLGTTWLIELTARKLASNVYHEEQFSLLVIAIWLAITPLLDIWRYAYSEGPFLLLILLYINLFHSAVSIPNGPVKLIWAGLGAGLATLCRYSGIACVMSSVIYLIVIKRSLRDALIFIMAFSFVILPWFVRNWCLGGSWCGLSRMYALSNPVLQAAKLFLYVGRDMSLPFGVTLGMILGAHPQVRTLHKSNIRSFINSPLTVILATWSLCYASFLLVSASIYPFDPIGPRLLSPLYIAFIPLILLAPFLLTPANVSDEDRINTIFLKRATFLLLITLIVGMSIFQLIRNLATRETFSAEELWIRDNTPIDALIIAENAWNIRRKTGRTVLEFGYPEYPSWSNEKVVDFIKRFSSKVDDIYMIGTSDQIAQRLKGLKYLGITSQTVYRDIIQIDKLSMN